MAVLTDPLFLLFSLGADRYALPVAEVAVVLPLSPCKQLPGAPPWVAGLLPYEGRHVPVIDLSQRTLGRPAAQRVSTRLVLVHDRSPAGEPALLGLILEQATDTLRCAEQQFVRATVAHDETPYLGPVMPYQGGLLQRVQVSALLDAATRAVLYAREDA